MSREPEATIGASKVEVSDNLLLNRYSGSRAPEPFLELVRRHTGLVYGTCLRITANVHDAEELTQECFFDLSRQSNEIRSSLIGWLHQAATHRALNRIRSESRRQIHEQQAGLERINQVRHETETTPELSWNEISLLVDQALEELPEVLRAPILMRYLEGATQADVANSLGVHQSTVSRRLSEGIERLRETIRKAGVIVPTAALMSWLTAQSATAAPPTLVFSMGKIGLAGVGSTMAANIAGDSFMAWFAGIAKGAVALLFVPLVAGILWGEIIFLLALVTWGTYLSLQRPEWFRVLCFTRQFPNIYEWPFSPLTRWRWQTPPREWRIWMAFYFVTGIQLLGLILLPDNVPKPSRFLLSAAVLWQFFMGIRIWRRVCHCRHDFPDSSIETELPVDGALLLTYAVACVVLIARLCASPWFLAAADNGRGIFLLNVFCAVCWVMVLIWGTILVVGRFRRWRGQAIVAPILVNRINDLAPPMWLLGPLISVPLAIACLLSFETFVQDLFPVYVRYGDTAAATIQRRTFVVTLAAMDCLVLVILPLAYLYRRIPRIVWGVTFGVVGLIGALHLGLFAKTMIAAPMIAVRPFYEPLPGRPLKPGHFILQNAPNLLANSSLDDDIKYTGASSIRSLRLAVDATISVEYGEHFACLSIPKRTDGRETEVVVTAMILPYEFHHGVPSQLQVSLIVVDPYARQQDLKQFLLSVPAEISPDDWKAQYKMDVHEIEKEYPLGVTINLGAVQGMPVTLKINAQSLKDGRSP